MKVNVQALAKGRQRLSALAVSALLALSLAGCGKTQTAETTKAGSATTAQASTTATTTSSGTTVKASETTPAPKVELLVSAAASLTDAINEVKDLFSKKNPTITVTPNYGSSGKLQQQISEGAPVDLFISAGKKQVDTLQEEGKIVTSSRVDILANEVVLIVPKDSTLELASFEDVLKDDVKMIAIGEASVPVGQYTQDIYTFLGIWDQVQAKANLAQDVRNVLAWVEEGEVDCGIVYQTDAAISDKVKIVATAPAGSHKAVIYPAAVIRDCAHPAEAELFLKFLQTDEAQAVFKKFGFAMAPTP